MADSSFSFLDATQQLESEMTDRQRRLISILTGQRRYESSAAEKELLENEIEERKIAIEKLEAQSCCDCCGAQVNVPETFRIRMTKYSEKLPVTNLVMEEVRVRAECADCCHKYDLQQRPERVVATKDEIVYATETLTLAEQRKLQTKADWRVRGLGRASLGRTGEDLFQDAWLSTFIGRKNWNRGAVDFFGHLRFAMRNISYGWKQKFSEWEPSFEADIITCNAEGDEISPLENVASSDPAADRCLGAKEEVERMFKKFKNDKEATAVLQARLEGVTTAREIMQEHKLTKRQYEAAQRRIRSQKSALIIEEHDRVLELLVRWLKAMDFAVVTASTTDEGLRLYRECGPFDVVMISYSPKLNGAELAMDIRKNNPSQNFIITTTYSSEEDVDRPSKLTHVPILLKPFGRNELRTVLQSSANAVTEKKANCFRPKRRRATAIRRPLPDASASRLPKLERTLNAPAPY